MSYDIDEIPEWCEEDYHSYLLDEGLDNISVSKMTLNDRAEWTNQYMESILNWANDSAIQFKADKPVIFLALLLRVGNDPEDRTNLPTRGY